MNSLWRDVRFGFRLLMRNPGFTTVAVMAFALGIAANTAIFSVVYATLLAPLPYPEPDQLVMVWSRIQGNRNVTAAGDFLEWQKQATAFQRRVWEALTRKLERGGVHEPEERLTREQAIRLYTINNAYLGHEEKVKGSLEVGKLGDLIVIDRDVLTCPVDDVKDTKVLLTVVGGKVVHEKK